MWKASWKAIISKILWFWRPTWRQVGIKIEAEMEIIFARSFCFSWGKKGLDPVGRSWEQTSIKNRCKKRCGNRRPRKLDFYWFLLDLGGILAFQNGAKTLKNRCWKGIKIWSVFEGLLESPKIGKSLILEGNMEASWHQNRSRNRCYLRKAYFWKNIVFLYEK